MVSKDTVNLRGWGVRGGLRKGGGGGGLGEWELRVLSLHGTHVFSL